MCLNNPKPNENIIISTKQELKLSQEITIITLTVSTGCIKRAENAHEIPPANADLRRFPTSNTTLAPVITDLLLIISKKSCNLVSDVLRKQYLQLQGSCPYPVSKSLPLDTASLVLEVKFPTLAKFNLPITLDASKFVVLPKHGSSF